MNIDTDLMLTIAAGVLLASFVKHVFTVAFEYISCRRDVAHAIPGSASSYGSRESRGESKE